MSRADTSPRSTTHPPTRGALVVLALLAAVAGLAPACARSPIDRTGRATVVEPVDGDTVVMRVGRTTETVRLLGVDTPETKHPTKPVECFGAEASARTAALLPPGTAVRLERDVEPRDRYGRLLAYVHLDDGTLVNLALVAEGYGAVLVIEPNHAHAPALRRAGADARAAGLGLWGACGGPDTAVGAPTVPSRAVPSGP